MNPYIAALFALAGASSAAIAAWLVARRKASGRIETTEAATLWEESQAMRKELREEAVVLRQEVLAMREEAVAMRNETLVLREEAVAMRAELTVLREREKMCKDHLLELEALLADQERDNP